MKNATKMSSRASRESTNCRPSKHSSRPATRPSSVEPVIRRASRNITSTISEPTTAEATRQPNGSIPKAFSPSAISHLPTSGWTTIEAVSFHSPSGWPARIVALALSVDVVAGVAEVQQRPRVLGVVGLVEEELVRRAELPQPQEQRQQGDRDGCRPSRRTGPPRAAGREAPLRWPTGPTRPSDGHATSPAASGGALRRPHRRGGRHGRQDYGRAGARGDADRAGRGRLAAAGRTSWPPPTWSPPRTPGGSGG